MQIHPIDYNSPRQIDDWIDLRLKLWPEHSREELEREAQELKSKMIVWLAYEKDHPIGFAEAGSRSVIEGSYDGPAAFIEGIYVDEGFRHKGLAKKLVEQVEGWAREQGFTKLGSNAEINNQDSDNFHRAVGFREVNRTINYLKDL